MFQNNSQENNDNKGLMTDAENNAQREVDEMYMRRCLQLADCGRQNAKPNPMVGAVIVCDGRIIGEGYHVRCGEGQMSVRPKPSCAPCSMPCSACH